MTTHASIRIDISDWQEKNYDEAEGLSPIAQADVTSTASGDVTGTGALRLILVYRPDGTAVYTGYERVAWTIGDHTGTAVLRHEGTFEHGQASTTFEVVAGSGTGGLAGLSGTGRYRTGEGTSIPDVRLDYEFG